MTGRTFLLWAALGGLVWLAREDRLGASPPTVPSFTRVFAPADRVSEWPRDGDKYLPVPAAEFERLVQLLERGQSGVATTQRCRVEKLTGAATIEPRLLRGTLLVDIVHDGGGPALLALEPWRLAVTAAAWESPTAAPAVLGMTSGGRTAIVVAQTGRLRIEFTLRATTNVNGSDAYELHVPLAPSAAWSISVPEDAELKVDGGLVASRPNEAARRNFRVDVEPGETLRLVVGGPATFKRTHSFASAVETLNYNMSVDGVEVVADFRLAEVQSSPGTLAVALDEELQPVSVSLAGQPVSWRQASHDGARRIIEFETPKPLENGGMLRVSAWCPLRADERWRLPRLSLLEAEWRDGTINVLVSEPLGVTELYTGYGVRQTRVGGLALPKPGTSYAFDCYAAEARLDVLVEPRKPRLEAISGVTVDVGPRETTARVTSDIQVADGEVFILRGRIAPDWLIDDVTSLTAQSVAEVTTDPDDDRAVVVRLNRSANAKQGVRLAVTARRFNLRGGESRPLASFEPIVWEQAKRGARYFSLRGDGEQRWKLQLESGAEFVTRDALSDAALELLRPATDETLVSLASEGYADVRLQAQPQRLHASILAEYVATPAVLQEQYTFTCSPEQNSIESLLVRFSQPRDGELNWTVVDAPDAAATALRLADAPAEAADRTELWRVRIWPPRSGPFTLRAMRSSPLAASTPVALVDLPGAETRDAIARVVADAGMAVETEANGLRPVLPAASSAGERRSTRAEFRYDPSRDVSRAAPAALVIAAQPSAGESRLIFRDETVTTHVTNRGECLVAARYQIDSGAGGRFALSLPPGATLLGLSRDGTPLPFDRQGEELSADIDSLDATSEVRLEYAIDRADQLRDGVLTSILPRFGASTHPRRWQLGIPSGWELTAIESPWSSGRFAQSEFIQRLLGPLSHGVDGSPVAWFRSPARQVSSAAALDIGEKNLVEVIGPSQGEPIIRLRQRSEAQRYFTYGALLAGIVGWRLGKWRSIAWIVVPACAASAALLVPAVWIPWTSGAFLGSLLTTLFFARGTSVRTSASTPRTEDAASSSTTRTMVLGAARGLAFVILLATAKAFAVDGHPARSPRVFVPIDAERKPTGERYFVDAELWRELQTQAARLGDESPEWILTNAQYTLGGRGAPVDARSSLRVVMDLRTYVSAAKVVLPLAGMERAAWSNAQLDGLPLPLPAADDLAEWRFTVREPGLHRLELTLLPDVTELHDHWRFDGPAFPVPSASLHVGYEPSAAIIEVDGLGEQTRSVGNGLLTAALGPANSWRVRVGRVPTAAARPVVELEQLLWLKVEPERVTADVQHRIVTADRPLGRLEFQIDPRWEFLGVGSPGDGPVARIGSTPARVQLEWNTPAAVGEHFTWRCQLKDRSGVGEISLPNIAPVNALVRRRWCAVTLDPALEATSLANTAGAPLAAGQFLSSWVAQALSPALTFTWNSGGPVPNLQTAFVQPVSVANERQEVLVHAARLDLTLIATIETARSPVFEHLVQGPRALVIESAEIEQDGARQTARWSRGENGVIHVFLPSATLGRHRLSLRGSLPTAPADTVSVPRVSLLDAELTARTVRLLQAASALVDQATPAPRPVTDKSNNADTTVAPVGEWVLPTSRDSLSFRLRANQPRTIAAQTTSLHESNQGVEAQVDCRLSITAGVVDAIRWEIPSDWRGPFTIDPAWPHQVLSAPGAPTSTLVVRPPRGLTGEQQVRFLAPIEPIAGGAYRLPVVSPFGLGRVERMVILPEAIAGRRLNWQIEGLRLIVLPDAWTPPSEIQSAWKAYEADGDAFQATAIPVETAWREPRILLADHTLRVEEDGAYRGLSVFSIAPGGIAQLPLRLPAGAILESSRILGQQIQPRRGASDTWLVPLLSDRLPQQMEILYSGRMEIQRETAAPAPRFENTPIDATQWTIVGPFAERVRSSLARTSPNRLDLSRYQSSIDALESGLTQLGSLEPPTADTEEWRWFSAMQASLTATRAGVLKGAQLASDRAEFRRVQADLDNLDQRLHDLLRDRPGLQRLADEMIAATGQSPQIPVTDTATANLPVIALQSQAAEDDSLVLLPTPAVSQRTVARLLLASALLAAAVFLVRSQAAATFATRLLDWRLAGRFALGVVFAIWASPSLLGAGLMGYSIYQALRQRGVRELPAEMQGESVFHVRENG